MANAGAAKENPKNRTESAVIDFFIMFIVGRFLLLVKPYLVRIGALRKYEMI